MKLSDVLRKLSKIIIGRGKSLFTYPVESQKDYMKKLRNPGNDLERSYNQYCCQMRYNNKIKVIMLNILALPLVLFYYLKNTNEIKKQKYDAVFFPDGLSENIIPDELKEKYDSWLLVEEHKENFSDFDKKYFKRIIQKYPLSWYFLLKCLIKIRFYSYEIQCHSPKAMVVCSEYSFTSSMLTDYCKYNNVKHINVMHGEKLFDMGDSFFRFDDCYVWNKEYIQLFEDLHAEKKQFIVALPDSMKINGKNKNVSKTIDYTYYLGDEEKKYLEKISSCMRKIKSQGYAVSVRPHPIYSNLPLVYDLFREIEIEDKSIIDIETSILRTKNVISLYSTVLNQAYNAGINIVIDNYTDVMKFNKLEELQYRVLNYEYQLLSDILEG